MREQEDDVKDLLSNLKETSSMMSDIEKFERDVEALTPDSETILLDNFEKVPYDVKKVGQCRICNCPHARQIEEMYIRGWNVNKIKEYFNEKGLTYTYPSLSNHLRKHCDWSPIKIDWLEKVKNAKNDMREFQKESIDYGMAALWELVGEVKGFDTSDDLGTTEKVANTVNGILKTIVSFVKIKYEISGLQDETEQAISEVTQMFLGKMLELKQEIKDEDTRDLIDRKVLELKDVFDQKRNV